MKKKFINGFLMVAMLFATTSLFVSCKDNIDDELSDVYNNLGKKSSELQGKIDNLQGDVVNLQGKTADLQRQIDEIEPYIDNRVTQEITQIIDTALLTKHSEEIKDLNDQLQTVNGQITNQSLAIDQIKEELNKIDERFNNMNDAIANLEATWNDKFGALWETVDSIKGILGALVNGSLITGIEIETTRNDVLGILNSPIAKVNALAAYYGTNDSGIEEFPYAGYDFNVGGNKFAEYLEDYELPTDGYTRFDESDKITDTYGNAGQIYFTVNSTNYDDFDISKFTKIQIENSVGEVAPIELNVRKSSARINWDFGRAFLVETGIDPMNGLHMADATITEENLDASKFQIEKFINFEKLKSEIKKRIDDIRTVEGEGADGYKGNKAQFKNFVRELASLAYGIMKNDLTQKDLASNITYSPQRLAFYAEKDGQMKRIAQTKLDLLTTAVKPLSYNTFWEYEKTKENNWIIETVLEKAVSKVAKEINKRWGDKGVKAQIVGLDETNKSVYIQVGSNVEEFIIKDSQYWSDLKKALEVNGGLDEVNEKLARLLKTYTLGTVVNKAEGRINAYLDKASEYLTNLINKHLFTRAVAPIIIFETSTGVDRLCEGMFVKRGIMHAYLTSGTMELLVPAYRKYVAVEKNGMLLESVVLPGNTLTHDFDLSEKGDYKIIISCVDYFGYVVTKKYTVYVK